MYSTILGSAVSILIGSSSEKLIQKVMDNEDSSSLSELRDEAQRAEIQAQTLLSQAKVEQELAISRRIDSAEEVEIEEYYDTSGKGSAGLNTDGAGVNFGLSGEGRRVTKRIIKFKGCTPITQELDGEA